MTLQLQPIAETDNSRIAQCLVDYLRRLDIPAYLQAKGKTVQIVVNSEDSHPGNKAMAVGFLNGWDYARQYYRV